jgi:glycosyltransferase involved in cell wall biosynthesis
MAKVWSPLLLYTGHSETLLSVGSAELTIKFAPEYDRRSNPRRLLSWVRYFVSALWVAARQSPNSLLFIVSNPPFLGLLGPIFKFVRGQRYVVLVYDIYPDLLIGLGALREGIISNIWKAMNRLVLRHASLVFTLGDDMALLIERTCDLSQTTAGHCIVISNWSDVNTIKPLAKGDNPFANKYGQVGKITVLYSGNMGNTHDIESILAVARELKKIETIHFLFIGAGAKWSLVEKTKAEEKLNNISLLPFQPEEILPISIASGDIGIVAYQPGTEACIVPSKTYYYMAAGLAPLVVSGKETDLSRMLVEKGCGMSVRSGDIEGLKHAILTLATDEELLIKYKVAARVTAEQHFSRRNTERYINSLKKYGLME